MVSPHPVPQSLLQSFSRKIIKIKIRPVSIYYPFIHPFFLFNHVRFKIYLIYRFSHVCLGHFILPEDQSSIASTHFRQFTTTGNSNLRNSDTLSWSLNASAIIYTNPHTALYTHQHTVIHTHTQVTYIHPHTITYTHPHTVTYM